MRENFDSFICGKKETWMKMEVDNKVSEKATNWTQHRGSRLAVPLFVRAVRPNVPKVEPGFSQILGQNFWQW